MEHEEQLILRHSDFQLFDPLRLRTLIDAMERSSLITTRGFRFYDNEFNSEWWSFADVVVEARRRGRYLRSQGLQRGARLGLIVPECRDFVLTFYAAISAGLVPVPMAAPIGFREKAQLETLTGILRVSNTEHLIVGSLPDATLDAIRQCAPAVRVMRADEMVSNRECTFDDQSVGHSPEPDETCFLQFTSGSTSQPKGVVVSHASVIANAEGFALLHMQGDVERDVALTWLPLHHDMGLIAFVCAPLVHGGNCVIYPTLAFMWRPNSWMTLVDKHRATMSTAPNFAYRLVARRQKNVAALDLSCLRVLGCGAEPIEPAVLRQFTETFAPAGLRPEAIMPCYGMAENTLAVTCERIDEPLRTLVIDRAAYELGVARPLGNDPTIQGLEVVSCGRPIHGCQVVIRGTNGELLEPGRVGEISLRGTSVTSGYYCDPSATAALFSNGWLLTGDLGFVFEGDLYVCGRTKDVIIVNGRNFYPSDVEMQLQSVPGLRSGGTVVIGVPHDGTERFVVVAEITCAPTTALRDAVIAAVTAATGMSPHDIVFVPPSTIPRTSSGKVQRAKTKAMYREGALAAQVRLWRQERAARRQALPDASGHVNNLDLTREDT
jgi:fatty-acyl-CoA synthase